MAHLKKTLHTEEEKLQKRLAMSYTERFHLLMRLIRINKMLRKAIVIPSDNK